MLISYLVPVYNVEKYIRQCLDSILSQKGADYEVVLLDDGSTDSSGIICDEYAQAYPEIVRVIHKENEGLLATRRRGFREARGDWFLCVDSDDYIMENHLQTIVGAIREYECDMLMFDAESFYPDGHSEPSGIGISSVQVWEGDGKQELYKMRLLKNKFNNMCYKAIKRSVLDYETDYTQFGIRNMCEDALQIYEPYTRASKIVYIPQILYAYRRDITSISTNIGQAYWHALRVTYELGWKYVTLWEVPDEVAKAYGARCVGFYCDYLSWLLTKENLSEEQKQAAFRKVFLENELFDLAVKKCENKYLATKYLKLRNPLLVGSIRLFGSWHMAKMILQMEQFVRGA